MRGIAILAIMLHNYCHYVKGIAKENEYQFLTKRCDRLWEALTSPDEFLPMDFLSFFGHYGVPVFLFLSGYGLIRKYELDPQPVGHIPFLRYHYLKLLRMLIVGFVLFIMVDAVTPGRFPFHWDNVIAQLLMYINVLPEPDKIIWPGIYWFFGLMMELYVVYRLLLYRRSSLLVVGLIAVCWLLQLLCDPAGATLNRLRYNFVGGMLPFGAGILLARHGDRIPALSLRPYGWLLVSVATFALVFALCFHFHSWLWIPLPVIVASVALVRSLPQSLFRVAEWIGSLSAAMFVAHPIARKLLIIVAWKDDIYDGLMLYVVVTIGLSWAVKQIIDHIPAPKL